ncbi:hypothetical protein [Chryseobacterium tongliaoense]|uniref:hypothetical protein n=1 Tax=Chryseobacterium tongliaoense TaxID=3240933 RepID=UPI00351276D5
MTKRLSYILLIFLSCAISCKDIKTFNKNNNAIKKNIVVDTINLNKTASSNLQRNNIDKKWYGIYKTRFDYGKIGGMNAGWDLKININSENITASGSGYQIGFKDELTATVEGNKLILKHKKTLDGYSLGENMNPEFTLIEDNDKFYVRSEWIDSDIITKPKKNGFIISKENL